MSTVITTEHPYIIRAEDICGGEPVIRDTRTSVRAIVGYYKLGMSVEEILDGFPHLTAAQVYDALSYYHDHQDEIEEGIQENRIRSVMERHRLKMDENSRLIPEVKVDE